MNPSSTSRACSAIRGGYDAGEPFQFYGAGIAERGPRRRRARRRAHALARACGVSVPTVRQSLAQAYGLEGDDLYALIQRLHHEVFESRRRQAGSTPATSPRASPSAWSPTRNWVDWPVWPLRSPWDSARCASAALGRDFSGKVGRSRAWASKAASLDAVLSAVTRPRGRSCRCTARSDSPWAFSPSPSPPHALRRGAAPRPRGRSSSPGTDPTTLDPHMHAENYTFAVVHNVFDHLVRRTVEDGQLAHEPGLASSWTSVNPTTWSSS